MLLVLLLPYSHPSPISLPPQQCFHQIMVGIYFLQLMLLCVLAVKRFAYALLVLPLVIFTLIFHAVQSNNFKRPWKLGNAREAALLDARDHVSMSFFVSAVI